MGSWYFKSTLYNRLLYWNKMFFAIGPFCNPHSISLSMASKREVLYGYVTISIAVLSTTKRYSSFLQKVFIFQKICFKVKLLKTFKVVSDYHIKECQYQKRQKCQKCQKWLVPFFEEPMLFLLVLTWNI